MTYLLIVLSLLLIGDITCTVLIWQHFKKTNVEANKKIEQLQNTIQSINTLCEKTVIHSNNSVNECVRRITQCEITVNQFANAIKILSTGRQQIGSYMQR